MSETYGERGQDMVTRDGFVETASATTSPDNADSGNGAYILTVAVLAVLIVMGVTLSSAFGTLLGTTIARDLSSSDASDGNGISLEDLERLLGDGAEGIDGSESEGTSGEDQTLSQSDALDLSLSLYDTTVDDEVDATAYSGVPDAVRSYVRSLLLADRDAASELSGSLNAMARGDGGATMQNVVDAAANGKAAIESVPVPDLSDDEVSQALASARKDTLDRWDAIATEVQLLDTDGSISYSDLQKADDDVVEKTSDAAQAFVEALEAAASKTSAN